tara:strand:+ start:128 stop:493 length:366 start_codon:yes stop_codon:yes gene_type:complete
MKIVSNDDKYVASTWGASISLKAGEPKEVSHELGLLCLQEGCTEYKGEMPSPVIEDTPVIDEDSGGAAEEVPVEEPVEEAITPDLHSMTKVQLEEYGRTVGIELDRRKKKDTLIQELEAAK